MSFTLDAVNSGTTTTFRPADYTPAWRPAADGGSGEGGGTNPISSAVDAAMQAMKDAQKYLETHKGIATTRATDLKTGGFRVIGDDGTVQNIKMDGNDGTIAVQNGSDTTLMKFDPSGKLTSFTGGGNDKPPVQNADGSYTLTSGGSTIQVSPNSPSNALSGDLFVQVKHGKDTAQAGMSITHTEPGDAQGPDSITAHIDIPKDASAADFKLSGLASTDKKTGNVSVTGADDQTRLNVDFNSDDGTILVKGADGSTLDVLKLDPASGKLTQTSGSDYLDSYNGSYRLLRGDTEIDINQNPQGSGVDGEYLIKVQNTFSGVPQSANVGFTVDHTVQSGDAQGMDPPRHVEGSVDVG